MKFLRGSLSSRSMEGNLRSDCSYLTHEESQRETESIDGGVMSCPQSPTDVSICSAPSSSLGSSVGRKRKVTAAEEGERLHIEKEKLDIMKSMAQKDDEKDTTYHFLISLKDPINRLSIISQMLLRYKITEIVMNEIDKNQKPNNASLQPINYTDYVLPTSTLTNPGDASTLLSSLNDDRI
ncbi:unnamed protein product [Acanthoscelides obtectus]|uniref:BESS domain-containing protein n=1 Tax=Acanthoscelides obtectus TaxID=200917 RepID=A0A9P0JVI6_ACAOB|nr:unnamed protein product [Acanthoscelides obtectus]CAK1657145.1 hypothetical protein AOBTE_LOCUS20151 [Acanthoscelides obtectus]